RLRIFFFSSRRRHTRFSRDWSSDVCSSDLGLEGADPGNVHLVPYMWHTTGIGYNPARVKAALGDGFVLDSWTQLFDPEVAGKLKIGRATCRERAEAEAGSG